MQKRGKDRGRPWTSVLPWVVIFALSATLIIWMVNRDSDTITLKYGELIQVLEAARQDPSVSLQKVKVSQHEIHGEIVTNDFVTDGPESSRRTRTTHFSARASACRTTRNCTACSGPPPPATRPRTRRPP